MNWNNDMQPRTATGSGAVSTGYLSVTATPTPLSGVPSALAGTEASLQELGKVVESLHARLEQAGVLRPLPPQGNGNTGATPPNFNSSLANALDGHRMRVHAIINALSELQDRIDL